MVLKQPVTMYESEYILYKTFLALYGNKTPLKPVTLKDVKANEKLADMALVTSFRLSVQPVKEDEWMEVCRMGGLDGKMLKPL